MKAFIAAECEIVLTGVPHRRKLSFVLMAIEDRDWSTEDPRRVYSQVEAPRQLIDLLLPEIDRLIKEADDAD